jgi:hypothetical protein
MLYMKYGIKESLFTSQHADLFTLHNSFRPQLPFVQAFGNRAESFDEVCVKTPDSIVRLACPHHALAFQHTTSLARTQARAVPPPHARRRGDDATDAARGGEGGAA